MSKKTLTITFNPALDKTIKVASVDYGKVNRIGQAREDLGGKGINVGRILTGFGMDNEQMTILGQDNLKAVLDFFEKDSMPVQYTEVPGHTRTNMIIVETQKDQTTNLNEDGVFVNQNALEDFCSKIDHAAKEAEYLIVGGSIPKGVPEDIYRKIVGTYNKICKVVLDADGVLLSEGLKGHPYMIKPNIYELENVIGRKLNGIPDVTKAARELLDQYEMTYVLVSMGKDGSLLVSRDKILRCDPIKTKVVSTVGAGDSMVAGFVYGLSQELSLEKALALGAACSTITIQTDGYPKMLLTEAENLSQEAKVTLL